VRKAGSASLLVLLILFPLCFAQNERNGLNSKYRFVETSVLSQGATNAAFGAALAADRDGDTLVIGARITPFTANTRKALFMFTRDLIASNSRKSRN
jgi:hypothetical protein